MKVCRQIEIRRDGDVRVKLAAQLLFDDFDYLFDVVHFVNPPVLVLYYLYYHPSGCAFVFVKQLVCERDLVP